MKKFGFTTDDMLQGDTIHVDQVFRNDSWITEAVHLVRDGVVIATEKVEHACLASNHTPRRDRNA